MTPPLGSVFSLRESGRAVRGTPLSDARALRSPPGSALGVVVAAACSLHATISLRVGPGALTGPPADTTAALINVRGTTILRSIAALVSEPLHARSVGLAESRVVRACGRHAFEAGIGGMGDELPGRIGRPPERRCIRRRGRRTRQRARRPRGGLRLLVAGGDVAHIRLFLRSGRTGPD